MISVNLLKLSGEVYKTIEVKSLLLSYFEICSLFGNLTSDEYYKIINGDEIIYTNLYYIQLSQYTISNVLTIVFMDFDKTIINNIKTNNFNFTYIPLDYIENKDFIKMLVQHNGSYFQHTSYKLKYDYNFVLDLVKEDGYILMYVPDKIKNDYKIVLEAVRNNGYVLKFASNELKNNYEIVMTAVKQSGYALRFASNELKNNYEIVMTAVNNFAPAIIYASDELQKNNNI
jgi:hypothetical protein